MSLEVSVRQIFLVEVRVAADIVSDDQICDMAGSCAVLSDGSSLSCSRENMYASPSFLRLMPESG